MIGATLSWEWTENWREYVEIAKRFGCRFDAEKKLWRIPTFAAAVELTRAFLEVAPATAIVCRDYETNQPVPAGTYVSADYGRIRKGVGKRVDLRLLVEGKDVYLAVPLDEKGEAAPEHAMYLGLAADGCKGKWVADKGFLLQENVKEAVEYLTAQSDIPVAGCPPLFETPFIVDTYGDRVMPHQERGISFLVNRRRALLADDMGLGKTMQSIVAAEQVRADLLADTLLVICPVSLVPNWQKELKLWESSFSSIHIVPYSQLKRLKDFAKQYPGGRGVVLIADEAHYLKNPASQRTKALLSFVAENAALSRLWLLTGTPVTRDFSNVWPLARLLSHPVAEKYRPSEMMNLANYRVLLLSGAMRTHMMVRKKVDLLDLPPKIRQVEMIDTGLRFNDIRSLEALAYGNEDEADEHIMRMKRQTAEAKVTTTVEKAQQILYEGRKVVIFSDHSKSLHEIAAALGDFGCVVLDGSTPLKRRQEAVEMFQGDPRCRVFCGNITAAGVGLTLTAAQDVIFNDFNWLPANMHQAEDRCHRIGARGTVNVWYLADCNLILDEILCEKLAARSEEIATFEQSKQSILAEVKAWAKDQLRRKRTEAHG
jgi:hypothetical protein